MMYTFTQKPTTRITKANNRAVRNAFLIYLALVFLLTFSLSENILDISPALRWLVDVVAQVVPSVDKIGKRSSTPQIAQLILVFELCATPILAYILIRQTPLEGSITKSRKHPVRFFILIPLIIAFSTWGIIYFFPGHAGGHGWASRISETMLTTRTGLAFWSSLLYGGTGASAILMTYVFIKVFPHVIRK